MTLRRCLLAAALPLALAACEREARRFETPPAQPAADSAIERSSDLQPGPSASMAGGMLPAASAPRPLVLGQAGNPHEANAYDVAQGKTLYRWFNCNGCHANGGGDKGPALMDARWRYGGEPAQIVATILQGRPNGMPSFAGRISQDQVWQIAAYVRSMSGQLRSDVAPSRSDSLSAGPPEQRRSREPQTIGP